MQKGAGKGQPSPWKRIYVSKKNAVKFTSKAGNECFRVMLPEGQYAGYSTIWTAKTAREVEGQDVVSLSYIPDSDFNYKFTKYDREKKQVVDEVVISSADIANVLAPIAVAAPPRPAKA